MTWKLVRTQRYERQYGKLTSAVQRRVDVGEMDLASSSDPASLGTRKHKTHEGRPVWGYKVGQQWRILYSLRGFSIDVIDLIEVGDHKDVYD